MSDACERDAHDQNDCRGCGARLSRFAVRVVHAETGVLLTRLCHRCASDLAALPQVVGLAAEPAAG